MGVYPSEDIYGVRWFDSGLLAAQAATLDSIQSIFFERSFQEKMSLAKCQAVQAEYAKLTDTQKSILHIQFYMSCSSTYGPDTFMSWLPGDWAAFEKYILLQQNGAQNS